MSAAAGPPSSAVGGLGSATGFLSRTASDAAAVLRIWREAKGHCWALPSSRTRTLLNMMVRLLIAAASDMGHLIC